jgi:hypothetical protein
MAFRSREQKRAYDRAWIQRKRAAARAERLPVILALWEQQFGHPLATLDVLNLLTFDDFEPLPAWAAELLESDDAADDAFYTARGVE